MNPFKIKGRAFPSDPVPASTTDTGDSTDSYPAPLHEETVNLVVRAYRGKTRLRTFPQALTIAAYAESECLGSFLELIDQCSQQERELIVSHIHKNYLHSPRLVEWIKAAHAEFAYAKVQVLSSGIKRVPQNNVVIGRARKIDRDTAGFNVRQESRDAVSIVNGLVQVRWTQNLGIAGQRSIIRLATSLAKFLTAQGDGHGLEECYREYTDLYGVRHSIVERDSGLGDVVLKHPYSVDLMCEYIESGQFDRAEDLCDAVLHSSVVLRHQQEDNTRAPSGSVARNGGSEAHYV